MASTLRLWINAETGRLLANDTSFTAAQPTVFHVGDTVPLELNLIAGAGVAKSPIKVPFDAGSTVKVAIGKVGGLPTSGQWRLSVNSTETADLAYNASASAVQTALNAISDVSTAGGVTVTSLGGGYSVTWNTVGTKPSILAGSDTLAPASYEAIVTLQAGDVSTREIVFVELRQNPIALATVTTTPTTSISSSVVASSGITKVVRVTIANPNKGSWIMTVGTKTGSFAANASASDIKGILANEVVDCQQTGPSQWDITMALAKAYTIDGTGLINSYALTGEVSLSTAEAIAYLGTQNAVQAVLEISSEVDGKHTTLVQSACTVANALVAPGAIQPVTAGTVLTEEVANDRFVRRDVGQTPTSSDLDVIWPNLGVSTDGSDTAAAISNANAPAAGNPFVTVSDLPDLSGYLVKSSNLSDLTDVVTARGNLGLGSMALEYTGDYLPKDGNLFGLADAGAARTNLGLGTMATETASDYLTTSAASSTYATISSLSSYLTVSSAASTYALLSSFDQGVKTTDSPTFNQVSVGDYISVYAGTVYLNSTGVELNGSGAIKFATYRSLSDVNYGGAVTTGGTGTNIKSGDYPAEVYITVDGMTYAMPARLV